MNVTTLISIAAASVAVGALAMALTAMQAMRWRARCDSLESSIAALRRELEMVASISVRTGRRVQRVEHEYSDVAERVDVVESRSTAASGPGSLDEAIDWARRGADPGELEQQFGLSGGEADLVTRLHGRKKSA